MHNNFFEVTGNIATKPGSRSLPSGTPVANVRLGQTYLYETKAGTQKHTNWFSLAFYGELAGTATKFEKGDKIHVTGTIEQREFTPRDGSTRKIYEVIVKQCRLVERPHAATSERPPAFAGSESSQEEVDAWSVL
jgi:single stranded DNA-binding protein